MNKNCGCTGAVNKYVDATKLDPIEWEDADYLLGIDLCGKPQAVNKPLYELTEDDRDKLDSIVIDGNGDLYLANDGTYKAIDTIKSLIMTYNANPANFVLNNLAQINRIKQLVINGDEPFARIVYNQYVLPLQVGYTESLNQLMFEYDAINYTIGNPDIQRIRISIALNVETEIPTVVWYQLSNPTDADYIIDTTGDGSKALYNDGTYKDTYTSEQIERILEDYQTNANAVVYNSNDDIEARNNIILKNDANLLGTSLEGGIYNLIQISRFNDEGHPITDIGSTNTHITLNSYDRPNVQLVNESGNHLHQLAYLNEVEDISNNLDSLESQVDNIDSRVTTNTQNITLNRTDIDGLITTVNDIGHFRGYKLTTTDVTSISNPRQDDYAYNIQTGTIWIYNGITWTDSLEAIPDGAIPASDSIPLVDGVGSAGTSSEYSRGDHRHPSDTSKANVSDLNGYLSLEGNTSSNRVTGDILMSNGSKLGLTDSGQSYIGLNDTSAKIDIVSAGSDGLDLITPNGTAKINGKDIASVDDISILSDSIANSYVSKSGDTMSGGLTLQGANITLDVDQSIRFSGNGAVRMGYNSNNGELQIVTTTTDNGIDVITNPSSLNSKFKYNGVEVATINDIIHNSDIIDNLTSIRTDASLSANQGRVLDNKISNEVVARATQDGILQSNIEAESLRASNAENNLQTQIDNLSGGQANIDDSNSIVKNGSQLDLNVATSDQVLTIDNNGVKAIITLASDGSDIVLKGKNGSEISRISIASSTITSGYYDSATQEIVLELSNGDEVRIPAADLVDIYTGGDYINIDSNNVISLDYEGVKDQLIADELPYLPLSGGTLTGGLIVQSQSAMQNIIPFSGSTYNLGNNVNRWSNVYSNSFIAYNLIRPATGTNVDLGVVATPFNNVYANNYYIGNVNKTSAINAITTSGTGNKYLADDGIYKEIDTSSLEARVSALELELLGVSQALSNLESNAI